MIPTSTLKARNGFSAVTRLARFTATDTHTGDDGCNQVEAGIGQYAFDGNTRWPGPGEFLGTDTQTA